VTRAETPALCGGDREPARGFGDVAHPVRRVQDRLRIFELARAAAARIAAVVRMRARPRPLQGPQPRLARAHVRRPPRRARCDDRALRLVLRPRRRWRAAPCASCSAHARLAELAPLDARRHCPEEAAVPASRASSPPFRAFHDDMMRDGSSGNPQCDRRGGGMCVAGRWQLRDPPALLPRPFRTTTHT
jgi:hypothetical protein